MNKEVMENAERLVEIKREMFALRDEEKQLKKSLLPYVRKNRVIKLPGGNLFFVSSKGRKTISRKKLLKYLKAKFGGPFAKKIDKKCTTVGEPTETIYVRVINHRKELEGNADELDEEDEEIDRIIELEKESELEEAEERERQAQEDRMIRKEIDDDMSRNARGEDTGWIDDDDRDYGDEYKEH